MVLLILWLLLSLLLAVPNVAWCMITSVCEHELAGVYTGPGVRSPGFHRSSMPLRPFWEEPGYRPPPERARYDSGYVRQGLPVPPPLPGGLPSGSGIPTVVAKANESLVSQFGIGRSEPFYYVFNLTAYGEFKPGQNMSILGSIVNPTFSFVTFFRKMGFLPHLKRKKPTFF